MRGTIVSSWCFLLFAAGCVAPSGDGAFTTGEREETPDPIDEERPEEVELLRPLFTDATAESGLAWSAPEPFSDQGPGRAITGGGAITADLDGDAIVDVLLTAVDGPNALFLGLGDGRFELRPDSGLEEGIWTFGGAAADLNGDGLREVFLFDGHELRLFENLGQGEFAELPAPLVVSEDEWVVGAGFVDYDGDGHVDIYVLVQGDWEGEEPMVGGEDRLLHGAGDLQFEDHTSRLGELEDRIGQGFAVTWLDVDRDGDLDAYAVNDKGPMLVPNRLFEQKDGWFEEASADFGLDVAVDGMGIAQGDLGHDGVPELAITNTDGLFHLFEITDAGAVEITDSVDAAPPAGPEYFASWAVQMEDFDNDGESDLLTAWGQFEGGEESVPGRVSLGLWTGDSFEDFTPELPELLDPTWRGVLPADFNGDGQLDWLQTVLVGSPAVVLGRPTGAHWLEVQLEGPPGNRDGLGAVVRVTANGVEQVRCLGAAISGAHSSQEPVAHFGLGEVAVVDEVRVHWPDGSSTVVASPESDRRLVVAKQ